MESRNTGATGTAGTGMTGTTGTTSTNTGVGSSTGTTGTTGGSGQVKQVASGIKGVFAKVHGAGEEIRGEFNGAVDEAFGEHTGVAKNSSVATAGRNEMETGKFASGTRQREGVDPAIGGGVGGRGERSV